MKHIGFFVLLIPNYFLGQNVFPDYKDNPNWIINKNESVYSKKITGTFIGDTLLCGKNYSIYKAYEKIFYFYSDSLRTIFKISTDCNAKVYTAYDYSKNINDTLILGNFGFLSLKSDTFKMLKNNKKNITVNGISSIQLDLIYKIQNIERQMTWIQGIGSLSHPFFPFYCMSDNCDMSYNLICFSKNNTTLYKNDLFENCDTFNNISNYHIKANLIFYNSEQSKLQRITNEELVDYEIQLIDQNGRNLFKEKFLKQQSELHIPKFDRGIYFVKIRSIKDFYYQKIYLK